MNLKKPKYLIIWIGSSIIYILYTPPHFDSIPSCNYHLSLSCETKGVLNNMNRYFGGIKLGTGGLVRAYGGVASECLKDAPTCLVKPKVIDV